MNIYDLGVLSGHYIYNAYVYSFQQMMEYLHDHKHAVARSDGWRSSQNYYYYSMNSYGQVFFNIVDLNIKGTGDTKDMHFLKSPVQCSVKYDLLKNKYALYPSLAEMVDYVMEDNLKLKESTEKVKQDIEKEDNND